MHDLMTKAVEPLIEAIRKDSKANDDCLFVPYFPQDFSVRLRTKLQEFHTEFSKTTRIMKYAVTAFDKLGGKKSVDHGQAFDIMQQHLQMVFIKTVELEKL